jgi:hypothetical protein
VNTDGKGKLTNSQVLSIIEKTFDLSGGEIIKALDLRKPIYKQVSTYGHFISPDIDLPLKINHTPSHKSGTVVSEHFCTPLKIRIPLNRTARSPNPSRWETQRWTPGSSHSSQPTASDGLQDLSMLASTESGLFEMHTSPGPTCCIGSALRRKRLPQLSKQLLI